MPSKPLLASIHLRSSLGVDSQIYRLSKNFPSGQRANLSERSVLQPAVTRDDSLDEQHLVLTMHSQNITSL
jgi:hypothetical protein